MQTITSSSALPTSWQTELQDLTQHIELRLESLSVRHPHYKPLEPAAEALERFQQLPEELRRKFLSLQLRSFLYGIYYNGSLRQALAHDTDTLQAMRPDLENNTFLGVDMAFYERLHESNGGEGYFSPGWLVVRQEEDGSVAVTRQGLTLHIERDRHFQPTEQAAMVGDEVSIRLPRNLLQNGFYMAVGNAGQWQGQDTVRVYFNVSADGAVNVMQQLTQHLNAIALPFSFKALYNPGDYNRYDAAVLYFQKAAYPLVQPILQIVYDEHQAHFRSQVPLFTRLIAPGLGVAEEPDHKFAEQESFGMNRCQIVANGLLEAWQQGDESPENRLDKILQEFALLNLDVQRPYLNANAEDIYTPLKR